MSEVINGPGTAGRARLPIPDVLMAGKTGTAQVVSLNKSDGKSGPWKYRDHGLFIFFAPYDNPRYAGAVVIEHGGGSGAAYPILRDSSAARRVGNECVSTGRYRWLTFNLKTKR